MKYIQNKNKIPKVAKKELVGIVNDLHDQCQLLYSVYHNDLESGGRKGKPGAAAASSSRSSSDLDYFSSEEVDISTGNVSEALSSDYAAMLRKIQETESINEDLKRQVSSLKQEMEQAGNVIGKRNEDRDHLMTKGEVALLRNQKDELASKLKKKTDEASEIHMKLKRLEGEKEKRAKAEMKNVEEKEALRNKVEKLDHLREENHKMHARIVELDSLQKERQMKNIDEIEDKSKKQEDTIHR